MSLSEPGPQVARSLPCILQDETLNALVECITGAFSGLEQRIRLVTEPAPGRTR